MYSIKTDGRGRSELFQPEMHVAVVERVALESELQRAVLDREFILNYQPIVSLKTGRVVGLEALIRWQHPTRGLLPPSEFLDVAEQTGAIVPIGDWVIDDACRQSHELAQRFPSMRIVMGVNLSPTQLFRPGIADVVRDALQRYGVAPADFVVELTEGVMVSDFASTVARLQELKEIGVMIAIDDFGTGYSSLSYLRQLPIDILKIDKIFIDGVLGGPAEAAFTDSIVHLAKTVGLTTVAEGVEETEPVGKLRDLGCELAQGYRFARPLHPDGVVALLGAAELETSIFAGSGETPRWELADGGVLA